MIHVDNMEIKEQNRTYKQNTCRFVLWKHVTLLQEKGFGGYGEIVCKHISASQNTADILSMNAGNNINDGFVPLSVPVSHAT